MNESALLDKGKRLCENKQFDEAINVFQEGLMLSPAHPELLYNQAKAYFRVQKLQEAKKNFDQLLVQDPHNPELLSERGVLFHHLGDNQSALSDLDRAQQLDVNNPFRYSSRAWIKAKDGDIKGAIADYEKAIELDPEDAISYNNKGLLEEQLGYKEKAKKSFDQSNKIQGYEPKFRDTGTKKSSTEEKQKEPPVQNKVRPGVKDVFKTTRELLSSAEERKAFWKFLLGKK